jgi:glycogen debranching enzyme
MSESAEFSDYQFRLNVAVAITIAPELFDPVHAVICQNAMEERLMGKIGMRTLDPADWRYEPVYCSGEESEEFLTAGSFNYHNGREWIWPGEFFFRTSMRFGKCRPKSRRSN